MSNDKQNSTNIFAKECLTTALLLLLKEKEFENISITDITKKAGISRSTYYRNYNSKEDILIKHIEGLSQKLDETMKKIDIKNNKEQAIFEILNHFKENKEFLYLMHKTNLAHLMNGPIQKTVKELAAKFGSVEKYKFLSCVGSIVFMVNEWLFSGEKESIEEMTTIICDIFHPSIEMVS